MKLATWWYTPFSDSTRWMIYMVDLASGHWWLDHPQLRSCAQRMFAYIRAAVTGCGCHKVHPNFGGDGGGGWCRSNSCGWNLLQIGQFGIGNNMELHHSWSQKQCQLKVDRIWIFFAAVVMSSKKKLKFFARDEQATLITTRRNPQPMR